MQREMKGALIGLICGIIWIMLGFWQLILILLLSAIGFLIGRYSERLPELKRWLLQVLER
ncbi:DUF2273 domain-containing protein [Loigolactobacillus coryniformis]|jgi:uncharacterized membrane protein|uniref:DUF2273 domain-containing protein n=2 Tax=Loigolactobacillus coryniformis TaxID=1610 RepID=A0A0R1F6B8_9LACO|nr:DUF2273 domain-containing protein [Loigolactobacillus coryniformis]MDN5945684.1 DUF2273 domain-containing protein [Lactiplantibacillus plantarum]MDT3391962.1 DUF2273 domain-containing protein [Bacillota bacterium]OEH90892.1 hypothetical protein ATO00_01050 [Loigolactobacillus coryniformis subsp. coryniformis]RRG04799.1 MAG: DUF2273 domain-containing protein [Lactobacillus sp.]ATO42919.1 DUF2273 domain-containing protein [Loigolactobacillus coryniformis subsp. torquens DSM 20004 = KCTC 3535]